MSEEHCQHDRVVSDSMGIYRCWECEPMTEEERREMTCELRDLRRQVDRQKNKRRLAQRWAQRTFHAHRREIETLRAERTPFSIVMTAAFERGIGEGKCDAGVLALADKLGFGVVRVRSELNVMFLGERITGRVVSIRAPLARPEPPLLLRVQVLRPADLVEPAPDDLFDTNGVLPRGEIA